MELRIAQRKKGKARIAFSGPSGCGKSLTALLVAYGICQDWSKVAVINTERISAEIYANFKDTDKEIEIGEFNIHDIEAPFTAEKYIKAIQMCEDQGMEVVIVDSTSHAWAGEGGLLDTQGNIVGTGKENSRTAWRFVDRKHIDFIDAMHKSKCHIIATMRAKTDYVQTAGKESKMEVKKVGLGPIQKDQIEYEFVVFFDIDSSHYANASKDCTGTFDGLYFVPTVKTGEQIREWLDQGKDVDVPERIPAEPYEKEHPEDKSSGQGGGPFSGGDGFADIGEKTQSSKEVIDGPVWCRQQLTETKSFADFETAWQRVKESEYYTALDDLQRAELQIDANEWWCQRQVDEAETMLDLETAWKKIKESEQYKALSNEKQLGLKRLCNTKKNTIKQNNGFTAAAA